MSFISMKNNHFLNGRPGTGADLNKSGGVIVEDQWKSVFSSPLVSDLLGLFGLVWVSAAEMHRTQREQLEIDLSANGVDTVRIYLHSPIVVIM